LQLTCLAVFGHHHFAGNRRAGHRATRAERASLTRQITSPGERNMIWAANLFVALVAALHLYFLVLEMFLWTRPLGLKTFRNSIEKATDSAVLAANQGLYNGFLAAGLSGDWFRAPRALRSRSKCSFCSA
jgi:Predicted membrane protein